jgi:hypothetical protein
LQEGINQQATYAQGLVERIVALQSTWWWRFSMLWRSPQKWQTLPTTPLAQRKSMGVQSSAQFATDKSGTSVNKTSGEPTKAPTPLLGKVGNGIEKADSQSLFPSPNLPADGEGVPFEAHSGETSAVPPTTINEKQSNPVFPNALPILKAIMRAQHITELFALDGHEFVTEAYRHLLQREPDAHGMAYYLGRLAQGHGKSSVITQLARAPEYRPRDEIKGLKQLISGEHRARHWFFGLFGSRSRIEKTLQSSLTVLSQIDHHLILLHSAALKTEKQINELTQQVTHSQAVMLETKFSNPDPQPSSRNIPLTSNSVADLPDWVSNETLNRVRALIGSRSQKT